MNAILSLNINKTDKNDARGITHAMRTGMFSRLHEKPQETIDRGVVLSIRRCLAKHFPLLISQSSCQPTNIKQIFNKYLDILAIDI